MTDDDHEHQRIARSVFAAPELRIEAALYLAERVDELRAELDVATNPRHNDAASARYHEAAFREALEQIARALQMPGSPDLAVDVPASVVRLNDDLRHWQRMLEDMDRSSDAVLRDFGLERETNVREVVDRIAGERDRYIALVKRREAELAAIRGIVERGLPHG